MARIFITGSSDGIGRAAAQTLLDGGHKVVLHARSAARASALDDLADRAEAIVLGDLSSAAETRGVADQVNAIGRMDAVIHNAGVYLLDSRGDTPEGHAVTLAINTLAPYMLTALMTRPDRLIYISSELHMNGRGPLFDPDWKERPWDAARAYGESKLYVTTLALAVARRWPGVLSNAVHPGWVRTKMGGADAAVDIDTGQRTQAWLAVSDDPAAKVAGRFWFHMKEEEPASEARDPAYQDQLIEKLRELTGVTLPGA